SRCARSTIKKRSSGMAAYFGGLLASRSRPPTTTTTTEILQMTGMKWATLLASTFLLLSSATATADKYDDTIAVFRNAGQSAAMFKSAYGYAEFPTIGK